MIFYFNLFSTTTIYVFNTRAIDCNRFFVQVRRPGDAIFSNTLAC